MEAEEKKVTRKPRNEQEEREQIAFYNLIRMQEKRLPILRWIFAVPNGGHRLSAVAGKLKAQGVRAGVFDNLIPVPRNGYHGAWIELKIKPNTLSPEQEMFKVAMEAHGYYVRIAWGDKKIPGLGTRELQRITEEYLGIQLEVKHGKPI